MKTVNQDLVQLAKEARARSLRDSKFDKFGDKALAQLALAYIRGEVSISQVATALGLSAASAGTTASYGVIAALRRSVMSGETKL